MFIVKRFAFIIVIFLLTSYAANYLFLIKKFVEIIYYFLIFLLKPNFACEKCYNYVTKLCNLFQKRRINYVFTF